MRRRLVVSSGKQTIAMLLSLVVTLPNLGCSFLQRPTQPVSIMATDPSALIYVNGAAVGPGAATVELARDRAREVMARTPDGRVGTAKITTGLSKAGVRTSCSACCWSYPSLDSCRPAVAHSPRKVLSFRFSRPPRVQLRHPRAGDWTTVRGRKGHPPTPPPRRMPTAHRESLPASARARLGPRAPCREGPSVRAAGPRACP